METALRRIADTLLTFVDDTVARYGGEVWWPSNWPGITWALLGVLLVLLWVASRRERRPRGLEVRPPQLLVTNGEVLPTPSGEASPDDRAAGARRRRLEPAVHATSGTLAMTVSNLSRYPVQVLEVALRDEPRGAPRVVAVDAVVPAMGSVTVEGPVPLALRGDGWLDLYCYAAATRAKMHRHRVELVWEPWSARYKVAPLEQTVATVRRLASDEPRARFLDDAVLGPEAPTLADVQVAAEAPAVASAVRATAPRDRPAPRGEPAVAVAAPRPATMAESADPAPVGARTYSGEREGPRGDGAGGGGDRDPAGATEVPRIATPPVGVAVTGRGGTAAKAPGGHPIGRPRLAPADMADGPSTANPPPSAAARAPAVRTPRADDPPPAADEPPPAADEPAPAVDATGVGAPGPAIAGPAAAAPDAHGTDDQATPDAAPPVEAAEPEAAESELPEPKAPEPDAPVRRPRLEFPDEF